MRSREIASTHETGRILITSHPMSTFQNALQFVHESLQQINERGARHHASAEALERLVSARPAPQVGADRVDAARAGAANRGIAQQPASETSGIRRTAAAPPPGSQTPATAAAAATALGATKDKAALIAPLRARALVCQKCPHLARTRTQVVFGVGSIDAELMFVGEAPGADEDLQGEPFVGKAGQLLTKIIETMGFARSEVYIGNVLKCRPDMPPGSSGNRRPTASEMATCLPYLVEQIEIIQPKVLVALGAVAMEGLLGETQPMGALRGRWHEFKGIPLMATYHPAYLLRNQALSEKRKVWEDMLRVLERLGKPISQKQRNYFLSKAG
jgi:uracil-DNA glycosylase